MAKEREVKVTVLGEDRGASKTLNSVEGAASKLTPAGESANKILGLLGSTLGTHLGPAGGIAEKGLKGLPGLFKSGTSEGLNFSNMLTGGIVGGAGAAAAALVAFGLRGVGEFMKVTGEVRQLKNVMGATAEEASGLRNVGNMLGIDVDTLAKGMFKLSVNLEKSKGDFAGVHVETAKNVDGSTNLVKTLDNVRSAYQSITDPQQKNIFLTEAMSKAGVNLRGVLSLTNDEFERFKHTGAIVTDKDLKMALEYSRAQREGASALQSLGVAAGRVVLPVLTEVSQRTAEGVSWADKHKDSIGHVTNALVFMAAHTNPVTGALDDLARGHKGAGTEAEKHAAQGAALKAELHDLGIEISKDEEEAGELTEQTKKAKEAAEKWKQQVDTTAASIAAASRVMGRATDDLTADQRQLAEGFLKSKNAADQYKQGLDILVGVHLTAARAAIDWEAKLDATRAALAENGRTLDSTTEKGRANNSAIIDMIRSGAAHVETLIREKASSETVSAAYADHVQALRNVMHQAGFTDEQINDLIDRYGVLAAAPDISKNVDMYYNSYHRDYYEAIKGMDPWVGSMGLGGRITAAAAGLGPGGGRPHGPTLVSEAGYDEWVITPDPAHRRRNLALLAQAAGALGVGRMAGAGLAGAAGWDGAAAVVVYMTVEGSITTAHGLAEEVQAALLQKLRRVPSLGLG